MLEHPRLVLGPWRDVADLRAHGRCDQVRSVADAASGQELGRARRKKPSSSWRPWGRRETWDVVESADESLVFTVHRPRFWSRSWKFFDAEDRCLGGFDGRRGWQNDNVFFPFLDQEGRSGHLRNARQHILASFEKLEAGAWRLVFEPDGELNPFGRMACLGAVLVIAELS